MRRSILIERCADADNTWIADIPDSDGEMFQAYGRKTCCYSRLCPSCIKVLQRKAQKRLVAARDAYWSRNECASGKYERFITLTGPTLQGFSLEQTNNVYNRAFALLSNTKFWSSRVVAGAKHVEFTVNERGYHTHIHVLAYSSFIERDAGQEAKTREWRQERARRNADSGLRVVGSLPALGNLQREWTKCLSQATREFGREIEWSASPTAEGWYSSLPTADGEVVEFQPTTAAAANIDIRIVREKGRPSNGEIGLPSAVKELTKYITKASCWPEVSDSQLVEIAEVRRWPRCFELLGEWRRRIKKGELDEQTTRPRLILRIMSGETWEDFCRRVERENADPLSRDIAWHDLNTRDLRHVGPLYLAEGDDLASLDTNSVFPSPPSPAESPPDSKNTFFVRSRSLMEIGDDVDLETWLKLVSVRLAHGRRTRARLLVRKYPAARFSCLDGTEFGGHVAIFQSRHSAAHPQGRRVAA